MKLENREFIHRKIAEGEFESEDQVVEEALRRWREEEQRQGHGNSLSDLRRQIEIGLRDLQAGRSALLDIQAIKDRLRSEFDEPE